GARSRARSVTPASTRACTTRATWPPAPSSASPAPPPPWPWPRPASRRPSGPGGSAGRARAADRPSPAPARPPGPPPPGAAPHLSAASASDARAAPGPRLPRGPRPGAVHEPVPALRPARRPVPQRHLRAADGVEVLQVPPGADPGDTGRLGALARREGAVGLPQGALDQPRRLHTHALGQLRRRRDGPRRTRQHPVHVGLPAHHGVPQPAPLDGVTLQPGPQVLEREGLQQVVDHA